ncbi:28S ribosomal protein s15, mitochondrial [Plakobranchus ocellatus]|uniref:Small ribosomal subunit protein uS15m n=1 Tax=Plakobranchus ocellatus TaxID=259542 RepID=A0AAV3Z6N3_9GAST|nr:28S ribosomal protein s15, mitochondrial [Plakobranchus ocellatus]
MAAPKIVHYLRTCLYVTSPSPQVNLRTVFSKSIDKSSHVPNILYCPCVYVPHRAYGRKVKPKPPKITHFEYSGDLRTLPALDEDTLLYNFQGLEDEIKGDETLERLSSVGYASAKQLANHRQELVRDRIIELFGLDSELEQEIALLTLGIRQMIPYCIQYRTDKGNKIFLLKRIFRRRRLLTHLREIDHERFEWLLRELKIRYVIPRDREEHKGWKHDKRVATQDEAKALQRQKLQELKDKLEEEKKSFYEFKSKILAEIERDLEKYGLDRSFLDELQVVEKETEKPHKILTWDERVKLGMTGYIKDYYG